MKIGLFGVNMAREDAPESILPLVAKVEALGFDSVWTGEHVVIPKEYVSRYPYNNTGKIGVAMETPFTDPLVTLSFVAAHTSRLKLATGINILPQTNPLLLAKQVASLDHLSGGRVLLGLGVGWLAEEFRAMGVPFENRGKRFDDYLNAMKKVWSGKLTEHQSEFLDWSSFKSFPLPNQRPHPPIIIGGHSPAALRRTVQMGDGWFGFTRDATNLAEIVFKLRIAAEAIDRDPNSIEITALWRDYKLGMDSLETFRQIGVSRLLVPLGLLEREDCDKGLDWLKRNVLDHL